jgi:hypothetical protein
MTKSKQLVCLVIMIVSISILSGAVYSLEIFDFEQPVFAEPGVIVKDHSLIQEDGLFHIFYIRGDEETFGHATSEDLVHWTIHDPVLSTGPEAWDHNMIWAPCVIEQTPGSGSYLMYYTGVNPMFAQQTGLATASSLDSWSKATPDLFTPFHGDTSWIHWAEDEWSNYRDPCIIKDDGYIYMAHTAHTTSGLGTIALGRSNDYFTWEDAGPLFTNINWHALESSFVLKRGDNFHLFFTEETVGGVSHMMSDSLTSGWNIYQRSIIDAGHAAEFFVLSPEKNIISRHTNYTAPSGQIVSSIKIDSLTWYGDWPMVEMKDHLEGDWTVLWGNAFNYQPIFRDNPMYRGEDAGTIGFEGNWWIGTYEKFNGPLSWTYPGDIQGDEPQGAIRSRTFQIQGKSMRLLVGGGFYPDSLYVALCDANNDRILFKETGRNNDLMRECIWDLSDYRDRPVYLTIVDGCSVPFGHINVDGIVELEEPYDPDPEIIRKRRKEIVLPEQDTSALSMAIERSQSGPNISNFPNPFNPSTEISFSAGPGLRASLVIYSVSGAEIRRLEGITGSDGRGLVRWDGMDNSGRPVSSGVYLCVLMSNGRALTSHKLILGR